MVRNHLQRLFRLDWTLYVWSELREKSKLPLSLFSIEVICKFLLPIRHCMSVCILSDHLYLNIELTFRPPTRLSRKERPRSPLSSSYANIFTHWVLCTMVELPSRPSWRPSLVCVCMQSDPSHQPSPEAPIGSDLGTSHTWRQGLFMGWLLMMLS